MSGDNKYCDFCSSKHPVSINYCSNCGLKLKLSRELSLTELLDSHLPYINGVLVDKKFLTFRVDHGSRDLPEDQSDLSNIHNLINTHFDEYYYPGENNPQSSTNYFEFYCYGSSKDEPKTLRNVLQQIFRCCSDFNDLVLVDGYKIKYVSNSEKDIKLTQSTAILEKQKELLELLGRFQSLYSFNSSVYTWEELSGEVLKEEFGVFILDYSNVHISEKIGNIEVYKFDEKLEKALVKTYEMRACIKKISELGIRNRNHPNNLAILFGLP